jgi:hypothetical protein
MKFISVKVLLFMCVLGCFGQSKAPESGVYRGSSTSSNIMSTQAGTGLPIYGSGVTDNTFGVSSTGMPSIFGDLIINKDGTYKLSKAGETGRWKFDAATEKVSFTGKLSASEIKYNYFPTYLNFQIRFPYNGEFISLSFSKKRELPYIKPKKPNADFVGTLIAEGEKGMFYLIDVQSGKLIKTLRGYNPSKNSNGEIIALSSFDGKSDIYIYDKNGDLQSTVSGQNFNNLTVIRKYQTVAISPDGKYIALGGNTPSYAYGGDPAYFILDGQGNFITKIDVNELSLWSPSWTQDNQCLIKGTDKVGLVNIDQKTVKVIYPQEVDFAILSQDQKILIFAKDNKLSSFNTETGRTESFANGKYDNISTDFTVKSMAWSPDQKAVAVLVKHKIFPGYKVWLLSIDGSKAKILANDNGEDWQFDRQSVSW